MTETKRDSLSRRGFLGTLALGGAAIAVSGLAGCAPKDPGGAADTSEWSREVDLLICGGGGSGFVCAVEAKDNGVEKVLVIEKREIVGGNHQHLTGHDCRL